MHTFAHIGSPRQSTATLGIERLDQAVHGYLERSLASSTSAVYASAARRCPQLPLQQDCLIRFVAHLAQSGVCYSSIRVYLNGVRFYHVSRGFPNPHLNDHLVLQYVLRGVHRSSPIGNVRSLHLPVTLDMLRSLWSVWSVVPSVDRFDAAMLWAACCLGFFGFLRAGEFTCPSWQAYTSEMLSPRDVTVDSHDSPSIVSVLLRRSKTDLFGAGVTIHLGRTQ